MNWGTVAGFAGPLVAFISAWLIWKRGRQVDIVSERVGAVTENRAGQAQINEDQQDFIAILQEDNRILRVEFAELKAQFIKLEREVMRLYRKYGENGQTPPRGNPPVIPSIPDPPKGT